MINDEYHKLLSMISREPDSHHFLWDRLENSIVCIGDAFIPSQYTNPIDYFDSEGIVKKSSEFAYRIFKHQIEDAISGKISSDHLETELEMKFTMNDDNVPTNDIDKAIYMNMQNREKSDGYFLHHINVSFFRNVETGEATDAYFYIRRCSNRDVFMKQASNIVVSSTSTNMFYRSIRSMINRNIEKTIVFLQFDIERFQLINDTHGSDFGDKVLAYLDDALNAMCDADKPHMRLNADIFMVVMPCDSTNEIYNFITYIENTMGHYVDVDYRFVFGVAVTHSLDVDIRKMQDNASFARNSVKGNALENIAFYDETMRSRVQHKKLVEDDMYKALARDEFEMYLQPKYSISTGRIIGAEALARWIHPDKGMISPIDFIPIFEQNGFILKLDQVIWEKACRKIRYWLDHDLYPVPISINVSREYLAKFDVAEQILDYVQKYDIPKEYIQIEITESIDSNAVNATIEKMKSAGFVMLMDDFGSGYSSLNMLKTTQFDVLKIDKEFLSEFMTSSRGRKIIEHTISMSEDIGLDIVAEGVETEEQASFLRDCGCDTAQGYLYSRPLKDTEFDKLLAADTAKHAADYACTGSFSTE